MPATYEPIATTTLSGTASAISFSSISNTYTDLRLILVPVMTAAANLYLRFNSDTGTNYSYTYVYGDGAAAGSGRLTSFSRIQPYVGLSTTPTLVEIDIFSYAGSTNKSVLMRQSRDLNGSGSTNSLVGLWRNTTAITTVNLDLSTSTFASGTTATLYGIKSA